MKVIRDDLYEIQLHVGTGNGSTSQTIGLARGLKNTLLMKLALSKVLNRDFVIERGKEKIDRSVWIEVSPAFKDEAKNFIETDDTSFGGIF